MTVDREPAPTWLTDLLAEHVIPERGNGGTAYEAYCVCSCGERNAISGGLRTQALRKARAHVAAVVWAAITERVELEIRESLDLSMDNLRATAVYRLKERETLGGSHE